jgi:ssDNA-binding Zn-finger/Zn-ribbon topoisomerase 1
MAHKHWKHYCNSEKREVYRNEKTCPDCNEPGEYAGYRLSVVEHMCSYSGRTKLPPYGEHRSFTDTLFDPYFEKCPNCDGQGVVDTTENNHASGDKCSICPVCHFNQYLFTGTPEEFDAIRKQVITAYFPSKTGAKTDAPATTETAPQPPPPASEPAPLPPTSPAASSQAFFTRPADVGVDP